MLTPTAIPIVVDEEDEVVTLLFVGGGVTIVELGFVKFCGVLLLLFPNEGSLKLNGSVHT